MKHLEIKLDKEIVLIQRMPLTEHQALTELLVEKDKQLQAALKVSGRRDKQLQAALKVR